VLLLGTCGGEDPFSRLWLLDLADGDAEQLLADPAASWNAGSGEAPEAERIRRERARERSVGIVAYSADADCRSVAFALGGQLWVLRVGEGTAGVPRPVPTAGPVTEPRIDPTGQRVAYVTNGAPHVVELEGGAGRLLAAPEHAEVTYGLAEHVAAESMHRHRGFWWAPDSRQLLAARVDNSPVLRWWIADPANPQLAPRAIRYPAAGTANAEVTLEPLTRPLLLIHGLADDNVVVAHTLRMSSALLAAGRRHQVLPLSGATHMPTDENTVSQLLRHQLGFLSNALGMPYLSR
jgi:dipeptidyl-peptidase-4